jgi:pyruvate/2-oxoglutarate dehydrogenase complex dihydrolipoamide acyltransferase (E2) component
MGAFVVRIPRVSIGVAEATVIEHLVPNGGRVEEGQSLFLLETEKVETEIPSGATGTVRWTAEVGAVYSVGTEIGVITTDGS